MAENSKIEWTTHTFNPWIGCTKISPACQFCYAERDMDQRFGKVAWGPSGTRVMTSDANWRQPIKWNIEAGRLGVRQRVFCASLADVFEDWQGPMLDHLGSRLLLDYGEGRTGQVLPEGEAAKTAKDWCDLTMNDVRQRLFNLIDETPNLDWLLLTKRPENILRMVNRIRLDGGTTGRMREWDIETPAHPYFRKNVWLGTTVENQEWADKRIPELLKCSDLAPVLFLSMEPLLGPVDLRPALWLEDQYFHLRKHVEKSIGWVIAGGESGPFARPSHPDWFRDIRNQCSAAGVPFHFKQWGEWYPLHGTGKPRSDEDEEIQPFTWLSTDGSTANSGCEPDVVMVRIGKKKAGRVLDGSLFDGLPSGTVRH